MPVSFPVSVSFYYADSGGRAKSLSLKDPGTADCYVGRDAKASAVHRLVLAKEVCDRIEQAVGALDLKDVHASAHASLQAVQSDREFFARFERGEIELPPDSGGSKVSRGPDNRVYAVVIRDDLPNEGYEIKGDHRRAALMVKVSDEIAAGKA